jgi:hypothetical protein
MTILSSGRPGPSVTTINTSLQSGFISEHGADQDRPQGDTPYPSANNSRLTKLPFHNTKVRRSYIEKQDSYGAEDDVLSSSPTYESTRHGYDRVKKKEEQDPNRETLFQDIIDYEAASVSSLDQGADKRTPRARRTQPRSRVLLESSLPPLPNSQEDRLRKRRRYSCDYDDQALASMNYAQLQREPFDFNPSKIMTEPRGLPAGLNLEGKLAHFNGLSEVEQREFFTTMSVKDWDRSGDWFLEQFGGVVQKLRESRQARRAMVEQYETEIANREEAVRLRTESINKKLDKIKHKGEDMLADKDI